MKIKLIPALMRTASALGLAGVLALGSAGFAAACAQPTPPACDVHHDHRGATSCPTSTPSTPTTPSATPSGPASTPSETPSEAPSSEPTSTVTPPTSTPSPSDTPTTPPVSTPTPESTDSPSSPTSTPALPTSPASVPGVLTADQSFCRGFVEIRVTTTTEPLTYSVAGGKTWTVGVSTKWLDGGEPRIKPGGTMTISIVGQPSVTVKYDSSLRACPDAVATASGPTDSPSHTVGVSTATSAAAGVAAGSTSPTRSTAATPTAATGDLAYTGSTLTKPLEWTAGILIMLAFAAYGASMMVRTRKARRRS